MLPARADLDTEVSIVTRRVGKLASNLQLRAKIERVAGGGVDWSREVWLFGLSESAGYRFNLIETLIRRSRIHRRGRRVLLYEWSLMGLAIPDCEQGNNSDCKGRHGGEWNCWQHARHHVAGAERGKESGWHVGVYQLTTITDRSVTDSINRQLRPRQPIVK